MHFIFNVHYRIFIFITKIFVYVYIKIFNSNVSFDTIAKKESIQN